jgi:hypothetical protein
MRGVFTQSGRWYDHCTRACGCRSRGAELWMGLGSCRISDNEAGLVQTGDMLQVTCYTAHDTSCVLHRIVSLVKGKVMVGRTKCRMVCITSLQCRCCCFSCHPKLLMMLTSACLGLVYCGSTVWVSCGRLLKHAAAAFTASGDAQQAACEGGGHFQGRAGEHGSKGRREPAPAHLR